MLRVLLILCCMLAATNAFAARKVALLIGNANYTAGASPLKNPANDVAAMKATLRSADFEVHTFSNLTRVGMSKALDEFSNAAADADIGLVFYSGHGMEVAGRNYLIPVDAVLDAEKDVKYEAIVLDDVLDALSKVKTLKLVLLDACRDNPRAANIRTGTRSLPNKGLARFEAADASNLLVAYATAPGEVAQDGEGSNSPFTKALVNHLVEPGVEVEAALRAVAKDVFQSTNGAQRPFKSGSLFETVTLGPEASRAQIPASSIADLCVAASIHWQSIRELKNRALLEEHLAAFGTCPFSSLAKLELASLPPPSPLPKPGQAVAQEVASLAPLPAPVSPVDEANLKRLTQAQLKRVGCYAATPDGDWGANSDKALGWFNNQKKTSFEKASTEALAALRTEPGRVCPLSCSVREKEVDGECVAKTCPRRQVLNRSGVCVNVVAQNAPKAVVPKTSPPPTSGKTPQAYSFSGTYSSGSDNGGSPSTDSGTSSSSGSSSGGAAGGGGKP